MSKKYVRNVKGQFRKRIKSAYEAGYDSVVSGADTENCHFAWFTTASSKEEWERGRDDATNQQITKVNK